MAEVERAALLQSLRRHQGRRAPAAAELGLAVRTIPSAKIREYDLPFNSAGCIRSAQVLPENPHADADQDQPAGDFDFTLQQWPSRSPMNTPATR